VPVEIKMPSLRSKHLPRGLSKLPKRGFTAPIGEWIAGPYRGRFEGEVLTAGAAVADILDVRRLRQLFTDHCAGRADHWYPLWAAWMYECWSNLDRSERVSSPVETAAHLA
jgi:asparagine synthase (glutamine-hydrolysing)